MRLAALSALLLLAGCSWSVRVEPGTAPQPPEGSAAPEATWDVPPSSPADRETQALYMNRCGRCHAPFPPTHATAQAWPKLVRKYGPRASLFGAERERVQQWLQAHAGSRGS